MPITTIVIIALTALIVAESAALIALTLQNVSLKKKLALPPSTPSAPSVPSAPSAPSAPSVPSAPSAPSAPLAPLAPTNDDDNDVEERDGNSRQAFLELDTAIDKDRLFLNPDFGRDDLCRLANMNKDRVGQLIKKYSGAANSQTYINRKRIAYAISLMREHPNYTMEAIATECGIGNLSTFYRVFKQMYNTAPSEYRQNMD